CPHRVQHYRDCRAGGNVTIDGSHSSIFAVRFAGGGILSAHFPANCVVYCIGFTISHARADFTESIAMSMRGLLEFTWIPHLPAGRIIFIGTTLLTIVFGADDLFGPERTEALSKAWLSRSTKFFASITRAGQDSAVILLLVGVIFLATVLEAV